jgi:peptidoglycan/xylan/chitin deacetylase (PgdA/CDA1 family)
MRAGVLVMLMRAVPVVMSRLILFVIFCVMTGCSTTSTEEDAVPGVVFHFETERKMVALTIDDGPDAETTGRILDVLGEHGAGATFFMIGNRVAGNESLLARVRDEGHELGNHGKADRPSILLSSGGLEEDMRGTHEILSRYGEVRWFRPGWGPYTGSMVAMAASMGYGTALGGVFPYDVFIPSSGFQEKYILDHVKPGSIILVHDGGGRGKRTAATLEAVLPQLRERGYEIVTLSELAEAVE